MGKDYYYNAFTNDASQSVTQQNEVDSFDTARTIDTHLEIKLLLSTLATIALFLRIVSIVIDIELGKKMRKTLTEASEETGLGVEVADVSHEAVRKGPTMAVITNASVVQMQDETRANSNSPKEGGKKPLQTLQESTPVAVFGTTAALTLVIFLLLVFDPSGIIYLNVLALSLVSAAFFQSQIASELRHKRYDRIASIFTLIIFLGSSLCMVTYSHLARKEGLIYEGPARIIGYDDTTYLDKSNKYVTRADLEVSFGGAWGCPGMDKTCYVTVQGALCQETKKGSRFLGKEEIDDQVVVEIEEGEEEMAIETYIAEEEEEETEEENEELEEEVEVLEEENEEDEAELSASSGSNNNNNSSSGEASIGEEEQLEEEVDELEDELEEEEDVVEEEEEELEEKDEEVEEVEEENEELEEEIYYAEYYSFEDDLYADDYWQSVSWGDTWGDFQCQDLFDAELQNQQYDASTPPGDDGWPFINIYGQCNTCDAYIVDYFSTEHFGSIKAYQTKGRTYLLVGTLSLLVTLGLIRQENKRVAHDNAMGLLPQQETAIV